MARLFMRARRTFAVEVGDGTDRVLFGMTMPGDTVMHGLSASLSYICGSVAGGANRFPISLFTAMSVEGWVLPLLDPDAAVQLDTLWDQLVPKDTDVETLDLDTGAADTQPFFEPGEMSMHNLFDVGLIPRRIYHTHKIISAANGAVWLGQDVETPFGVEWTPGGTVSIRINRNIRVEQPSAVLFAFGAPLMDDTTGTARATLAEAEIPQVKFMTHVLERALLHQLGVIETGAETPWEEASFLLRKHLNPDVFEGTTGQFLTSGEWAVAGEAAILHSVTGELGKIMVSTGR